MDGECDSLNGEHYWGAHLGGRVDFIFIFIHSSFIDV